jgi:hypothetical protein
MEICLSAQGFRYRRDQDHLLRPLLTLVVNGMSMGSVSSERTLKDSVSFQACQASSYTIEQHHNTFMAVAAFTWIRSLGSGSSCHISVMRDESVDDDDAVSTALRSLAFQSNHLRLMVLSLDDVAAVPSSSLSSRDLSRIVPARTRQASDRKPGY